MLNTQGACASLESLKKYGILKHCFPELEKSWILCESLNKVWKKSDRFQQYAQRYCETRNVNYNKTIILLTGHVLH